MIESLNQFQRVQAHRPKGGWRLQPFTIADNDPHLIVPAVAGKCHIITDAFACSDGSEQVAFAEIMLSDGNGIRLIQLAAYYEQSVMAEFGTSIIVPVGVAIYCERVKGSIACCLSVFGYTDEVEVPQTVYTGI